MATNYETLRQRIFSDVKKMSTENPNMFAAEIIKSCWDNTLGKPNIHDINDLRKLINAARKKLPPRILKQNLPLTHKTVNDLNLKTDREEIFVLFNSKDDDLIILGCETNLLALNKANIWCFEISHHCTEFYEQLLIIQGFINELYIPLLYCIIQNPNVETYQKLFMTVIQLCESQQLEFAPSVEVVLNFKEDVIRSVLANICPRWKITEYINHVNIVLASQLENCGLSNSAVENILGNETLKEYFTNSFKSDEKSAIQRSLDQDLFKRHLDLNVFLKTLLSIQSHVYTLLDQYF